MYALRWLNSPQRTHIFELKPGTYTLGRGNGCEFQIRDSGVSKQHAQFQVTEDKIILRDLNSTNGTFVNGVKVQHQKISLGDKITIHNLLFDIVDLSALRARTARKAESKTRHPHSAEWQRSEPINLNPHWGASTPAARQPQAFRLPLSAEEINSLIVRANVYLDTVVMPGVLKFAAHFDFRLVLASLWLAFIVLVTVLATIPMARLTRQSIEQESGRRALTLARFLEARNREAVSQNLDSALDVTLSHEEGVQAALIVAHNDGHIMAPASRAGRYDSTPFIAEARSKDTEMIQLLSGSRIGAAVPIRIYSGEQGVQVSAAHVIIFYDMTVLSSDANLVLSMLFQVFVLACFVGAVFFVIWLKLLEEPINKINMQLDSALREGGTLVESQLRFAPLESLAANLTSALSRVSEAQRSGSSGQGSSFLATDIENLVQMQTAPCLAIRGADETIIAANGPFAHLANIDSAQIFQQSLDAIIDQALRLNLQELISRCRQSGAMEWDQLEMPDGRKFRLACKSVAVGGQIGFYFILLNPLDLEMAA